MKKYISFNNSILIGLFAILLTTLACKEEKKQPETVRSVFYQKVNASANQQQFTIPGIVQFDQEAKMSFKVGGVITKVNAVLGQKIKKGNILAVIDNTDYQVQVQQALAAKDGAKANEKSSEAQIEKAKAQLVTSKSNFLRIEKLYLNNHTSLNEFEKAKTQYENAKAALNTALAQKSASASQVNVANAQVTASQNQLNYTRLTAPINGTIAQIMVEENEMVGPGMPVLILSSENDFAVKTTVPEVWIDAIKTGQEVSIQIASIDKTLKGKISEIMPNAPTNTGYPIKIVFNEPTTAIKSGMSVKVVVPNSNQSLDDSNIIIDTDAVSKDVEGYFVYVLEKNTENTYSARKRKVEVGQINKDGYSIKKGLEGNELIATAGIRFLYDGINVKLQESSFK